jgi:putative peptidoglycan lipid II flippase
MLRIESYLKGVVFSSLFTGMGQLLTLALSMLMANYFGAGESMDVYYYCLGAFALAGSFMLALDAGVLIPEAMRLQHQEQPAAAMHFLNYFLYLFAAATGVLTVLMCLQPAAWLTAVSRFPAAIAQKHLALVCLLIPAFGLQIIAQYLSDILMAHKFFTLPALYGMLCRLINILLVWWFHPALGILSLAWGLILGLVLQIGLSLFLLRRSLQWDFRAKSARADATVWRHVGFTEIAQAATVAALYLPLFMFSGMAAGAVAAMNYAKRMADLPTTFLTGQFSAVFAIQFNEQAARKQYEALGATLEKNGRLMMGLLVPLSFLLCVTGRDLVTLLFQRGAFDAAAAQTTGRMFSVFILGLPFLALSSMTARLFMATRDTGRGTFCQVGSALLMSVILFLSIRYRGVMGYPFGLLAYYILFFAVVIPVMARWYPYVPFARIVFAGLRQALAALPPALLAAHAASVLPAAGAFGRLCIATTFFGCAYILIFFMIPPDRMLQQEARTLLGRFSRKQNA